MVHQKTGFAKRQSLFFMLQILGIYATLRKPTRAILCTEHKMQQYTLKEGQIPMQNTVLVNRIYRHFKGDYYIVVGIAKHSETEEEMVVYRQLYGAGELWVRPMSLFISEVDRNKYPDVKQKYRFELQDISSVK